MPSTRVLATLLLAAVLPVQAMAARSVTGEESWREEWHAVAGAAQLLERRATSYERACLHARGLPPASPARARALQDERECYQALSQLHSLSLELIAPVERAETAPSHPGWDAMRRRIELTWRRVEAAHGRIIPLQQGAKSTRRSRVPVEGAYAASVVLGPTRTPARPPAGPPIEGREIGAAIFEESYLEKLAVKQCATIEDLLRAVGLFTGALDNWVPTHLGGHWRRAEAAQWHKRLLSRLVRAGVLMPDDLSDSCQSLTRATASLLFARALCLRGGITGRVFGLSPHTAYLELSYKQIMPPGGDNWIMNGAELLSVLEHAKMYRCRREAGE